MTTTRELEVVEFALLMAREFPEVRPGQLVDLMRLSRRHCRLQEKACSEPVPAEHDAKIERRIMELCQEIDPRCFPKFFGDPRGVTVRLKVPSGKTNDWGAEGVCVPQ